jgi:hypothetical protein
VRIEKNSKHRCILDRGQLSDVHQAKGKTKTMIQQNDSERRMAALEDIQLIVYDRLKDVQVRLATVADTVCRTCGALHAAANAIENSGLLKGTDVAERPADIRKMAEHLREVAVQAASTKGGEG